MQMMMGKPLPWTAARLNTLLGASILSWFEAVPGYLLDVSNVNVADGASVTKWIDRRDTAGSQSYPFATATGSGLTWSAAGKSVTFDGTNYLNLNTPVVVNDPNSGSHSTYYIVTGAAAAIGSATTSFAIAPGTGIGTNGIVVEDDTSNAANGCQPFVGGLIRVRRWTSDSITIDATGAVTYQDSIGAPFTFDTIGQWRNGSTPTISPAAAVVRAILVVAADAITNGTDGSIRSYLQSTFGVAL